MAALVTQNTGRASTEAVRGKLTGYMHTSRERLRQMRGQQGILINPTEMDKKLLYQKTHLKNLCDV